MQFERLQTNPKFDRANRMVERIANQIVRRWDDTLGAARLGGRKATYDDSAFEFEGGSKDQLRRKHYDKSLRLLWKAEEHASWLSFRDCSSAERQLLAMASDNMTEEEKAARERLCLPEYKELLNREYTQREKEAIVSILAAIGHGEAYAWMVSTEVLGLVKSTGARAALTMQVFEEAKHFVVLRELLQAFDVPIRRQSAWEYLLLENVYKAQGLEKLFGMNVVVEGIALSLFGLMSSYPGLEVLRRFHIDESRHTALPGNYFSEFPLSTWQKHNPMARLQRLKLILPALALIPCLEEDLAVLGIDAFEFGGSALRKLAHLSERNGFYLPVSGPQLLNGLNGLFNFYCKASRPEHSFRNFMESESTVGAEELAVEREVFAGLAMP